MSRKHILKHLMLKNLTHARTAVFAVKKHLSRWLWNTENNISFKQLISKKTRIVRFGSFFHLQRKKLRLDFNLLSVFANGKNMPVQCSDIHPVWLGAKHCIQLILPIGCIVCEQSFDRNIKLKSWTGICSNTNLPE